ncbi:MAG: DegQ family serine endoprotease [Oleiphilaceae bacterium]|nr:DegQ family serine endoprotease [Oleiphilaceae bacterium]
MKTIIRNRLNKVLTSKAFLASLMLMVLGLSACDTQPQSQAPAPVLVQLPDFTQLVNESSPAVVNISTTRAQPERQSRNGMPEGLEDWFERFFGRGLPNQPGGPDMPPQMPAESLGSGFIISSNGDILTNYHVVADAEKILVRLSDRREFEATLVGHDKQSDLALLHIEAEDLPVVKVGDSEALKVGEWVLAIGSPFGFDHSVTAGIVSAKQRSLSSEQYVPFIQTDVAINPGNSGGPLFNLRGEVVGVNSQIFSRSGGYMGLSFAIPINVALNTVEQLREQGYVSRGWLGVVVQEVTRELAESFGLSRPEGALVVRVVPESPAEEAGLEVGDVILEFNGQNVERSSSLPVLVGQAKPGEKATVTVLREGKKKTLKLKAGELAKQAHMQEKKATKAPTKRAALGLNFQDLTDDQRQRIGIDEGGVVVTQVQSGPAAEAGIRNGDIILRWGAETVESAKQLSELIESMQGEETIPVLVQRGGDQRFLALRADG